MKRVLSLALTSHKLNLWNPSGNLLFFSESKMKNKIKN